MHTVLTKHLLFNQDTVVILQTMSPKCQRIPVLTFCMIPWVSLVLSAQTHYRLVKCCSPAQTLDRGGISGKVGDLLRGLGVTCTLLPTPLCNPWLLKTSRRPPLIMTRLSNPIAVAQTQGSALNALEFDCFFRIKCLCTRCHFRSLYRQQSGPSRVWSTKESWPL